MILPIGHEDSEVRRLPWVTFGIMAACLVMLLATDPSGEAAEPTALAPTALAADYWRDHPYLKAPPEVEIEVSYDVAPNQRTQYIAMLKTSVEVLPEPEVLAEEQATLDAILSGEAEVVVIDGEGLAEDSPYVVWGLRGAAPTAHGFLTHMFMHAGWFHLLGNLFTLFLAGPALEDRWGRPLYAAFYVLAGLVSGTFFIVVEQTSAPLVGASGAIAGVLGAFLVRYAKTPIKFFYFFFFVRIFTGTFSAPAWAVLPLWFANELLAASIGVEDGVAYWAHVGGFAFGVAAAFAITRLGIEERFASRVDAKITVRGNAAVDAALEKRASGDLAGAFAQLDAELTLHPGDADAAIAYWDAAVDLGRCEEALPKFTRAIKALLPAQPADAARCWAELAPHAPDARLDPISLLAIHKALAAEGRDAEAKRALRDAADPKNRALTPALALRVLETARETEPQAAAWAARYVVDAPNVAEEKKAKLRAQLAELEAKVPPPAKPAAAAGSRRTAPLDVGLDDDAPPRAEEVREASAPFDQEIGRMLDAGQLGDGGDSDAGADVDTEADFPVLAGSVPTTELEPELGDEELGALIGPRFADTKVTEAAPKALDERGVVVALAGGGSGRIVFEKIQAVAVAAVGGLSAKPVVLIDLLLNWSSTEDQTLRVVRLRGDKFDPRSLAPGAATPQDALRDFLRTLIARTGAAPLPDSEGAHAAPIRRYADLATYQREVLEVA